MCDFSNCPVCGVRYRRHDSGRRGAYCSDACRVSLPFPRHPTIRWDDIERASRLYSTQKMAAKALGIAYKRFLAVVAETEYKGRFLTTNAL